MEHVWFVVTAMMFALAAVGISAWAVWSDIRDARLSRESEERSRERGTWPHDHVSNSRKWREKK